MNKQPVRALIVTRSTSLANGLDALLGAISPIDEVQTLRTIDEALTQIESAKPRIALIDAAVIGNRPAEALERIVVLSPETQRLLLVEDMQHVKWIPRYAEAVLIKGVAPSGVTAIVTSLLFPQGE